MEYEERDKTSCLRAELVLEIDKLFYDHWVVNIELRDRIFKLLLWVFGSMGVVAQ